MHGSMATTLQKQSHFEGGNYYQTRETSWSGVRRRCEAQPSASCDAFPSASNEALTNGPLPPARNNKYLARLSSA